MSLFEWSDEYSVNLSRMDEEHKKLIDLINKLDAEMDGDQNNVMEVMDGVLEYIKIHFASEEQLMKENDYPDFLSHRQAHVDLTLSAVELRNIYVKKPYPSKDRISVFLIQWLAKHIMGVDKKYGTYLNAKGIF